MPSKTKPDGLDEFHPDTTSNPEPVAVEVPRKRVAKKAASAPPAPPGQLDMRKRFRDTGKTVQDRRKRFREQ